MDKLMSGFSILLALAKHPFFAIEVRCIVIGVIFAAIVKFYFDYKAKNKKKFRKGVEYGSARWGTADDIKPYINPLFQNNILLTNTERLTMESRVKPAKYARNKNVLVIGGSGSGKTRFFIKPNIMQMHSSYVVTDPKGTVLPEVGSMLKENGYKIISFNTIDFSRSSHYNPFAYINDEKDILKLVNTIIMNTDGEGTQSKEDFWVKAERLYFQALIGYIFFELPDEDKNFSSLLDLIDASEVREDDENFQNGVDILFEWLADSNPKHFAVRQYKKYKLAAGKTAKSILISCGARLAPFDINAIREITDYDELNLQSLGDRKTALFVIISDTDRTFNFLVAIMYTQLFNILCTYADNKDNKGRLKVHVRCLLDEFANIGKIPMFEVLIATIRSREISCCMVLQAKSQLKALYKEHADTIIANCDSTLFLGGGDETTLKGLSDGLGKETIDIQNTSENRGKEKSFGQNNQKLGKALMTMDELKVLDNAKCIFELRGERPFKSDKIDIEKHENYKKLADADPKNYYDIVEDNKPHAKLRVGFNEEFILIDV